MCPRVETDGANRCTEHTSSVLYKVDCEELRRKATILATHILAQGCNALCALYTVSDQPDPTEHVM